ncbi:TolC family protein [Segetibacter aerophilus]|uniref:Membrane protein n=1 Tax=Segetibacter aerophilus TaxID=670293 RepID=A0A512BCE9_9BACT|nr:TolC family protein [Segetibacter aerophilus]GEO09646.1 membrane protein [Segetibacter aerophilus]
MKKTLLSAFLLFAIIRIDAQVLTLQEAINIALKNSLDIEIARNNVTANEINNHISVAGGLPNVDASITNNQSLTNLTQNLSNGTTTKRNGNLNNSLNGGIGGSLLLYNGLRVHATKKRLEALQLQSEQLVTTQIQNIVANVMLKYYDIVRQNSYIETLKQSIEATLQRKKIIDVRQSVGLANNADTYQAQLDLTASQQELQSQELVIMQAKSDLMNLMTQRPDSAFAIRDTIIVDSTVNFNLVRENLQRNPEVLSAEQEIRINELIAREVGAQRYPSVSLNTGFNYARTQSSAGFTLLNQNLGPYIGFTVGVPIFNGGLTKRQVRVADISTKNAGVSREILLNTLETSAVKSWQAYQNTLQRLQLEKENNRIAAALLQLTLQRYELSAATIIEVREAQRSFVEAGYRLTNLSYSAKVAEIELKRLASQLGI